MKWIGLVCLLGVSCGAPPKRTGLMEGGVPPAWTGAGSVPGPVIDHWWTTFGDTNLNAVVEFALQRNHDLKAAAARLEAASAQARIAGADLAPSLNVALESRRQQQNFVGLPIPGAGDRVLTSRSTVHALTFNTAWELDVWGRIRAGRRAALADWQTAQEEVRAAHLSLAAQAAKLWLAATETRGQLELARATAESYATTARQVRERYDLGLRSPLDLRLALSSEASANALVAQRKAELQTVIRQLEILAGQYPAAGFEAGASLPQVPAAVPAGLPSDLLERRPDILAAERRIAAADALVWEARAALFPRISLTASGGRSSSDLSDLTSSQFNIWALAGNFAQPLLEGGRLRARVRLAKARVREAIEIYHSTVLGAFSEVETRLAAEELLERREGELRDAAGQATAALQLAEERYRAGLEDFVTILEAQRRALETESQLLAVRRLRLENRIELHLALGGGFETFAGPRAANVSRSYE